jgi:hypothetical protein
MSHRPRDDDDSGEDYGSDDEAKHSQSVDESKMFQNGEIVKFDGDIVDLIGRICITEGLPVVDEWVQSKCELVDSSHAEEQSLKFTELHEEFKCLYEKNIECKFSFS